MNVIRPDIEFVLRAASRLVGDENCQNKLKTLPIQNSQKCDLDWRWIELPEWASDIAPKGKTALFVPNQRNKYGWLDYDWWLAAKYMITSGTERRFESDNRIIHSYSFRLPGKLKPAFQHAWVNRIIRFLRRWWCHINNEKELQAFPPIPCPIIHLTHDVDAVSKTLAIRSKQVAFKLFNRKPLEAFHFMVRGADYWQFEKITELENRFGYKSLWNFYAGRGGWNRPPKEILFDPSYNIKAPKITTVMKRLHADGNIIGLHPRFDTWADLFKMRKEKDNISHVLGYDVVDVRQHWLRFSFSDTWKVQKQAGLSQDYTLGFNDIIGFRNSSALAFKDPSSKMRVIPTILMDSHLFDYQKINDQEKKNLIDYILDELVETGGEASIIWHQRVFHSDYSWGAAYEYLLNGMKNRGIKSSIGNNT